MARSRTVSEIVTSIALSNLGFELVGGSERMWLEWVADLPEAKNAGDGR